MPIRRGSTSAGQANNFFGATSSRVHKTSDSHSHHGYAVPGPPLSNIGHGQPSSLSLGNAGSPQQKVVHVLVQRLKTKLPCNSGLPLEKLESDPLTQQAIETLVELSHDSLDIIAWALSELADRLAKQPTDNSSGHLTIETLQSQLFVLKVLSMTMASRWNANQRSASRASDHTSATPDSPRTAAASSKRTTPSVYSTWPEPAPLDDSCAKYVLSVMALYLRQTTNYEVPLMLPTTSTDLSFRDFELGDTMDLEQAQDDLETHTLRSHTSSSSLRSASAIRLPALSRTYEKTHRSFVRNPGAVSNLIAKYTGRIIFHISATNWAVVYNRLKFRIRHLGGHSDDSPPDTVDLQLMAHCVLDRQRLVMLLNDLSSLLINMGKEAQLAVAISLRTAVWNWIDRFPQEFNEAIRTRGRTEGAPERVFDLLFSMATPGHERIFLPCLTILSSITYERISADFQGSGQYGPKRKDQRLGQEILKHIRGDSKLSEISLACAVDMCRIAAHVTLGDDVPLTAVASDMAHEIKAVLWNGRNAFWDSAEEIDVALYSDALCSIFRFLPEEDSIPLLMACMEPARSDAVKTCVIRASLTLSQESSHLPVRKSLDRLQETVGFRCQGVLKSCATRRPEVDENNTPKRAASRPRGKRTPPAPDPIGDRDILVLAILSLWRTSPGFTMKGIAEDEIANWFSITSQIWDSALDICVKVSTACCLSKMTELAFTAPPKDMASRLAVACLQVALPKTLLSVASNLLTERVEQEAQHLWTALAHQIVDIYSRKIDLEHVRQIQLAEARVPALTLAEIAFMVTLPAANVDMSHLAAKGLRLISLVDRQPDVPASDLLGEEELSKRNFIYEQLGDSKVMLVGRVGHQKRIRKLIRLISYTSPVHPAVWAECYSRWKSISHQVYEVMDEGLHEVSATHRMIYKQQQELRAQWQNLTLFLATLCGACAWDVQESMSLLKSVPKELMPDKMRVPSNVPAHAEQFVSSLIELLMHEDRVVRDTAREALGSELSPKFYAKLIRNMDEQLRLIVNNVGKDLTESVLLFLDQFITVLRLLADNKHTPVEDVMSIDVTSLMHQIAEIIDKYHQPTAYRIKIKFCGLCKAICDHPDILTMRKDDSARNHILDLVMKWLLPNSVHAGNGFSDYMESTVVELNMACLRTGVRLLDRLQLRLPDVSGAKPETTDVESALVISGVFKRYSDQLLKCLDDCLESPISDSTSELGSVTKRTRTSQKEAELRELVITGLTHLVSSNSESGFKQCLHLAYDPDPRKRTIFAHVFARVIGEGTSFDIPEKVPTVNKRARFADLLLGSDMVLAMTMCEICPPSEVDTIIPVLLSIFETQESMLSLLKLMIEREVAQTDTETSLFRSNSTCTRLLSAFARTNGYNYLRTLVSALIDSLKCGPRGTEFELDPYKAGKPNLEENVRNVDFAVKTFIDFMADSTKFVPPMLRQICVHIGKTVQGIWPGSEITALGAFIFIRFISPAVVSPESIDLVLPKDDEHNLRRGLMNVGRAVQSLANYIIFGTDLPLSAENDDVHRNAEALIRFLDMLQRPIAKSASPSEKGNHTVSDDTDIIVLHRFFDKHADKIGKELLSLSKPSTDGDVTAINGKRAWDGLCALLVDLGSPPEVPRPSTSPSNLHLPYIHLMEDSEGRDTSRVRKLFTEVEVPPNEPALFVFNLSQLDVEDFEIKDLLYHIFTMLQPEKNSKRQFDVVIDCTGFSSKSELPFQYLKFCAEVLPADIRSRFRVAHILNPNQLMHKYLRRLFNVSAGVAYCHELKAYVSVGNMLEYVHRNVIPYLTHPIQAEQEAAEVFQDVSYIRDGASIPVQMSISQTHLRITTTKTFNISMTFPCRYVEIIPLSEIKDAYNTMTEAQTPEFVIRRRHLCLTFSSANRDAIVKHLRSVKAKLKDVQAPLSERFSRFSNIPATLLHIGFLSVDPMDEELRSAAYDLLGAVCTYLKYDKTPIVARKAGFIPGDPFAFVIQLSEQLAEFAPQLTLDFIHEICATMITMDKAAVAQRISCLHYLSPWIRNLSQFANPTSALYDKSGTRLRDCVRTLADLSLTFPEIISTLQKCVWSEVAKLDSFAVDIIFDELVRAASDGGGIGTRRCEIIRQVVASLSSIHVRSRMYSKLRKALNKMPGRGGMFSSNLTDHPAWNEISTLIRLASALGSYNKQPGPTQLLVPEVMHLVSLLVADGPTLVRKSVYGIIMNLLQGLYISRTDDFPGTGLLQLIDDCSTPAVLKLFGLLRETPTSEYTMYEPANEKERLDNLQEFMQLLLRLIETASGSRGLLNIWRARWLSLVTATAFQVSPVVQTRSFVALGGLATSDVDEDFMYQILAAMSKAFDSFHDSSAITVVSMLRCVCKLIPALNDHRRYVPAFFWLGVALLEAGHPAFFAEASALVRVSLETMEKNGLFRDRPVSAVLLEARQPFEEVTLQLDDMLSISFETEFSISLAHVIFKGIRHSILRESAEDVLRTLLRISVKSYYHATIETTNGANVILPPDSLGYFLALLPLSSSSASYRRLLKESSIDDAWHAEAGLPDLDRNEASAPKVKPAFLGINDSNTALMISTFIGIMLGSAQGDDAETEMLYGLLAELALSFPDVISLIYESVRERIRDTFASSSNPTILRSVSTILRVYVSLQQDAQRHDRPRGSSQSTLNDRGEDKTSASPEHMAALDELDMKGLTWRLTFVSFASMQREEYRQHIIEHMKTLINLIS